ncbi:60S ribosomal protein L27a [Capsicum chinense]|nr:60S ribosomal protein L27a [Capsicum chinense]
MTTCFKKNRKKLGHVSAIYGHIEVKDKAAASKGSSLLIDVTQYGYFKVLGKGVLPENQASMVKAKPILKNAKKKIKENGGAIVLTA